MLLLFGLVGCLLMPAQAKAQGAPSFKVDAAWPSTLPYTWAFGMINGLAVGPDDHVWVLHEPRNMPGDEIAAVQDPAGFDCCIPAPEVLEFDQNGKVSEPGPAGSAYPPGRWQRTALAWTKRETSGSLELASLGTQTFRASPWEPILRETQSRWTRSCATVRCSSSLPAASCCCK